MALGFRCALLLLPAAALAAPAWAAPPPREVRLPNGIRALLAPDPAAAAVDVATWHPAGSAWETPAQSGASYLLERLALGGGWSAAAATARAALEAEGGTLGSFTTPDFASFHATVPPEALGVALRLEASRLTPPALGEAAVVRERRAARESLARLGDGGPVGRALQSLYSEVFGAHPYGRQVTGDPAARDAIAPEALRAFASSHYGPPVSRITVVGRFDPDSALAALRRTVGAVPRRAAAPARVPAPVAQNAPQRVDLASDGRLPLLAAAWRLPGSADSARAAFPLLATLLVQGPGARLVRELVQQPGAPALRLEGALAARGDATLLYFVAALRENADSAAVQAAVLEAAAALAADVPQAELERARREVELRLRVERQTVRGRAQALGTAWMMQNDWNAAEADLERLRTITRDEVRAAAARVLRPEAFTAVWILPSRTGGAR